MIHRWVSGCFVLTSLCLCVTACDGDWFGPLERGTRAAAGGWDMWETPAVRPFEDPVSDGVPGTVAQGPVWDYAGGRTAYDAHPQKERAAAAALAYRRYCHHCHGPSGDGRVIVGESFDVEPTDLRGETQELDDESLFTIVAEGSGVMLALQPTMTPLEVMLAIHHLRTLKDARSKPYFPRKYVTPLE